ncbi:MAG: ABC transporter permease [bacterium]|nr:ABC transporter permease [bacterium]
MFTNYLKIALRNLLRHKGYSIINIAGLAIGMACCIMIMLWRQSELSINKFHEKVNSIYLICCWEQYGSERTHSPGSPPALGPALKAEDPRVVNAARFINGQSQYLLSKGETRFKELIQLADPGIFQMFSFPFLYGDPKETYSGKQVLVLSESMAKKFFGDQNPVGKTMTIDNQYDFKVVGVMKDIPPNSTIKFDVWAPLDFIKVAYGENFLDTWYNLAFRTYVELGKGVSYLEFNEGLKNRIRQSNPETNLEVYLYPFKDIYLQLQGKMTTVRLFSLIAILVLCIACINFINLITANGARRAREVGLRKVVGATRGQLIKQFFGETVLMTFIALILSVLIVELFLPFFNQITGKALQFNLLGNIDLAASIIGIALVTGLLSGSYPALVLSNYVPVKVLKGTMVSGKKNFLRRGLVVFQFTVSVILIISTTLVYRQMHYIDNKELGFNKKQLIYLPVEGKLNQSYEVVKHDLLQCPQILGVTKVSDSPAGIYQNGSGWQWDGKSPDVVPEVTYLHADADFPETFQMRMSQGKFFDRDESESSTNIVINQRFAEIMDLGNPIGKTLQNDDVKLTIIGVVEDFHFKPVYEPIGPLIIVWNKEHLQDRYIFIRIRPENLSGTLATIKQVTQKLNPEFPFEYHFLDQEYEKLYRSAERMKGTINIFTGLAILISCLGLFGLAAYTTQQRSKEIGVRKVLGAAVHNIVTLLSKEYVVLVILADLIACPIAYYFMNAWLQDFAYRIDMGWVTFVLGGMIALFFTVGTVSFQAIKAAMADPVKSLHYE